MNAAPGSPPPAPAPASPPAPAPACAAPPAFVVPPPVAPLAEAPPAPAAIAAPPLPAAAGWSEDPPPQAATKLDEHASTRTERREIITLLLLAPFEATGERGACEGPNRGRDQGYASPMRWWLAAYAMAACGSAAGAADDGAGGAGGAGGGQVTAGGSGGGTSGGVAAFCASLAAAECSPALVAACALPSVDACKTAVAAACASGTSDATFGRRLNAYDPKKADTCLAAAKAVYGDGSVDATELVSLERACDLAFSGGRAVGASCAADVDCDVANGLVCAPIAGALVCALPGTKQKGDACTATSACAPEIVCSPAGVCADGRDVSAACTDVDPCKPALRCVQGACAPKAKIGGACDAASACGVGYCVLVPTDASASSRLCLAKLAYAAGSPICRAFGP